MLLPNGKVLALGGSAKDEDVYSATLGADLFDPARGSWSSAGREAYARLYHSVALLLPDGTVAVAGSNPKRGTYEPHIEIYSPAYLFTTDAKGNTVRAIGRSSQPRRRLSVTAQALSKCKPRTLPGPLSPTSSLWSWLSRARLHTRSIWSNEWLV